MLGRIKIAFQAIAVSNIKLYDFVRNAAGNIPFLLPHDSAFHAFKKIGDGERIFLDIGANDGISARSYRKLVPNRPIVSIEPNPYHETALLKVKASIINFNYYLIGAGETNGQMVLYTPIYQGIPMTNYASLDPETARKNLDRHMKIRDIGKKSEFSKHEIVIRKLDEIGFDPAIIKIDVEGFEDIVISGLLETIKKYRPMIMIEHNQRSFSTVKTMLMELDYTVEAYNVSTDAFFKFPETHPELNAFFLPRDASYR